MIRKFIFTVFLLFICNIKLSYTQIYATPELEKKANESTIIKQDKLKFSNSFSGVYEEVKNTEVLSNSYLNQFYSIYDYELITQSLNSKEDLNRILHETSNEFKRNNIYISKDFSTLIFKSNKDPLKYRIRKIEVVNSEIVFLDCDNCNKDVFKIIENNTNNLVIEVKSQDLSDNYIIKLTLN